MNLEKHRADKASRQYLATVDFCHTLERFKVLNYIETIVIGERAYNSLCPF